MCGCSPLSPGPRPPILSSSPPQAFNPDAEGASAEEVVAMLGSEQPVPVTPTTNIPTLDDLPAVPDVAATLAQPDPALPPALDRDSLEADAAAVRSVMADVAVAEGVQIYEMDPASLPLAEDLEVRGEGWWWREM